MIWQLERIRQALKLAAVCSWIALAVLSLLPGSERPHTGMHGDYEHVVAYILAGLVTRLALPRIASHWPVLAFSIASGFFEICQIWIPGRTPEISTWLASSIGTLLGVLIGRSAAHVMEPRTIRPKN
jgi:VanZ family protein